jgi:hypothetical protein
MTWKPVAGGVAIYMMDSVEIMKELEIHMKEMRMRICRGEGTVYMAARARTLCRKLINSMDMVQHHIEHPADDKQKMKAVKS